MQEGGPERTGGTLCQHFVCEFKKKRAIECLPTSLCFLSDKVLF